MGQGDSGRIRQGSCQSVAPLGVIQRDFEIPGAGVEHCQRTDELYLIEEVAACLGNSQASLKGSPRRTALPVHVHQRSSEARLQAHLLSPAPGCIIESAYGFLLFFQAEDGIRDLYVTGVQTCALPISHLHRAPPLPEWSEAVRLAGER